MRHLVQAGLRCNGAGVYDRQPENIERHGILTFAVRGAGPEDLDNLADAVGQGLLKDMGRTVVSSSRVFRRVQLVVANLPSTFGVAGAAGTSWPAADFLTGYIELGFEGGGVPTPVAAFGR
jgi:hypothetical protein